MYRRLLSDVIAGACSAFRARLNRTSAAKRLAIQAYASGDYENALHHARTCLCSAPDDAELLLLAGNSAGRLGLIDAVALLQRACQVLPQSSQAAASLGNALLLAGKYQAAEHAFVDALRLDEYSVSALHGLGKLAELHGSRKQWTDCLKRALGIEPRRVNVRVDLVRALIAVEDYPAAEACVQEGFNLSPDDPALTLADAVIDLKLLRPQLAKEKLLTLLKQGGASHDVWLNLGIAAQDLGDVRASLDSYDHALAIDPDSSLARFHKALCLLLASDFEQGWQDYEVRLRDSAKNVLLSDLPSWDGSPLQGRTVLVRGEQGLGDQIMFASCLDHVMAQGGRLVIECEPRLKALFARSFPDAVVRSLGGTPIADEINDPSGAPDYTIAIGSLPKFCRRRSVDFPYRSAYLHADPARVAHWRAQLAQLGPGLKVGVSWRGGTMVSRRDLRSLPLETLNPVFDSCESVFVSLQYGGVDDEVSSWNRTAPHRIVHWPQAIDDYDETAALVCALDLVITVCTSVVHLCGALGVPTWVVAPHVPEWRYGLSGASMPWYSSVEIFRQPHRSEWQVPILQMADRLRGFGGQVPAESGVEK